MVKYLQKKGISLSIKEYTITALSYMALGLFSSLIIGLIIKTTGEQLGIEAFIEMGSFAMDNKIMGGAIGVAIAYGLKAPPLVLFAVLFAGAYGAELGGPAVSYVAALFATEIGKLFYKLTRVDIIVTPLVTIFTGFYVGKFIGIPVATFMIWFGDIINWSTTQRPIVMGIVVAVLMGWALTAPISSVAIAFMLSLDGLAAGAAALGCSAQMIGFASTSYKENGIGGFIALGIGTSMLQVANIIRNPLILIPPTVAGAVIAPIGITMFEMTNNTAGAGMGTSGFVGQIMMLETMGFTVNIFIIMIVMHFIAPAFISIIIAIYMKKRNWIKPGDLKISYE